MSRHRYAVLDSYRFIAALGVVFYHFEGHLSPLRGPQTDVLDHFQSLVDFFFVLSGFVLMHTYGDRVRGLDSYGDFLRKRLARIYPLQVATVLLCIAIAAYIAARHIAVRDPSAFDLTQVPQNLLLIHAWGTTSGPALNFPSWSISAEAFVYLLFPLFAVIAFRLGAAWTLVLALVVAVVVEATRAALGLRPGYVATFDFGMLRAVPSFLAGMAVCRIVESRPATPLSWWVPTTMAVCVVGLMLAKAPLPVIIACYPLLVGLIATADRGGRPTILATRGFVMLGDASFAIYMLHSFIAVACVLALRHLGWKTLPELYAAAFIGILLVILSGIVSFKFFESPLRRYLGGTRRRGTMPQTGAKDGLIRAAGH